MEITSKFKEREHQHQHQYQQHHHSLLSSSPLNSPTHPSLPITRSDPNSPYPTTFVTADTSSFKQVVQMLTGSSERSTPKHNKIHSNNNNNTSSGSSLNGGAEAGHSGSSCPASRNYIIPPVKTTTPKKQGFKLYERRNSIKHLISPLNAASACQTLHTTSFSPRYKQEILSPSLLDFPSLTLSPVTPLLEDPFDKSSPRTGGGGGCGGGPSSATSSAEEDKAIAEKGFYLHPSPSSTPRDSEPQLLPLFPLSSPRVSEP